MSKPISFPKAKKFSDLFTIVPKGTRGVPWRFEDYSFITGKKRWETIPIGPYLSVRNPDFRSFSVRPHDFVVEHIKKNMLPAGPNDTINFEIVIRSPRQALVVASNSVIIGSRWLALIDPRTIPRSEQNDRARRRPAARVARSRATRRTTRRRRWLGIRDHKVLVAFIDRQPQDGHKLSTDGRLLRGYWLGGGRLAYWERGYIILPETGSRTGDAIQRAVRRHAAPVQLAEYHE